MTVGATVFIECSTCDARVQSKVLGEREYGPGEDSEPSIYQFVHCSQCGSVMVGSAEWDHDDEGGQGWGNLSRQWPEAGGRLNSEIPPAIRRSLCEAKRCYTAKAYMSCAVMSGRAVEGLCGDKTSSRYLAAGLKKLKADKVIDEKLYEWGEALRESRNIGAHAGEEVITREDASDVLDFALALTEYVYVLDEKYKEFMQRKASKRGNKSL